MKNIKSFDSFNERNSVKENMENNEECFTVGELIAELKQYPESMKVRYTCGGSGNFGDITYVDTETDYDLGEEEGENEEKIVVIGELTW